MGEIAGSYTLLFYLFRGMRNDAHPPTDQERLAGVKLNRCDPQASNPEPLYRFPSKGGRYVPRGYEVPLWQMEVD
jgi:hypothetical protein